jgi:hypothetical protein
VPAVVHRAVAAPVSCWTRARGYASRGGNTRFGPLLVRVGSALHHHHSDAGGIADLDPDAARAGSIGAVDSFGNDALCAKPAGV